MANNRMYLRCPVCPDAKPVMLAKYYPTTGWFAFGASSPDDAYEVKVNEFFDKHHHESQWGSGFALEFEIEPDFPAPNQPKFTVSLTEPFPLNPAPDS
jgi:hypothetical protein